MQYRPYDPLAKYSPLFDPMTATAMGLSAAGGVVSSVGTLAGGSNAAAISRARQAEAEFESQQDVQNSATAIAGAQRQAIDIGQKAKLLQSTARASAAASGVNAGTGSALQNQAQIGARGQYASSMELWSGQNQAADDLNKAASKHYQGLLDVAGGEMEQQASEYSAIGTLASSGATALGIYGKKYG